VVVDALRAERFLFSCRTFVDGFILYRRRCVKEVVGEVGDDVEAQCLCGPLSREYGVVSGGEPCCCPVFPLGVCCRDDAVETGGSVGEVMCLFCALKGKFWGFEVIRWCVSVQESFGQGSQGSKVVDCEGDEQDVLLDEGVHRCFS